LAQKDTRAAFQPRFDGRDALAELLKLAGCTLDVAAVAERFQASQREGRARSAAIPELFSLEPHFPDPEVARRLYENLFGLWELVGANQPWERPVAAVAAAISTAPAEAPGAFEGAPDEAWVERAWRHLDGLEPRTLERLEHAFENRQDALWELLEEAHLSDAGYQQARTVLFELWAMLEAGWPEGLSSVTAHALRDTATTDVPAALTAYVDEALFLASQDEDGPLAGDEVGRARAVLEKGLAALWGARRPRAES
jgi:hypothetical protein